MVASRIYNEDTRVGSWRQQRFGGFGSHATATLAATITTDLADRHQNPDREPQTARKQTQEKGIQVRGHRTSAPSEPKSTMSPYLDLNKIRKRRGLPPVSRLGTVLGRAPLSNERGVPYVRPGKPIRSMGKFRG